MLPVPQLDAVRAATPLGGNMTLQVDTALCDGAETSGPVTVAFNVGGQWTAPLSVTPTSSKGAAAEVSATLSSYPSEIRLTNDHADGWAFWRVRLNGVVQQQAGSNTSCPDFMWVGAENATTAVAIPTASVVVMGFLQGLATVTETSWTNAACVAGQVPFMGAVVKTFLKGSAIATATC